MRLSKAFVVLVVFSVSLLSAQRNAPTCDAVGEIQFICDVISPEDFAVVPGSEWVIASGDQEGGRIQLVSVRNKIATPLFLPPHMLSDSMPRHTRRVRVRSIRKKATISERTVSTLRRRQAAFIRSTPCIMVTGID